MCFSNWYFLTASSKISSCIISCFLVIQLSYKY
uniref:Uncharacterized protein n=1 Tax=Rhizophora mucronata TaxID=61149 RepID=A0A2P2PSX7_RHIMU